MKTILTCTLTQALPVGTVIRVDEHECAYSLDIVEYRSKCLAMSESPKPTPSLAHEPPAVIAEPRNERNCQASKNLREKIQDHFQKNPDEISSMTLGALIYGSKMSRVDRQRLTQQLKRLRTMGFITNHIEGQSRSTYWRAVTK